MFQTRIKIAYLVTLNSTPERVKVYMEQFTLNTSLSIFNELKKPSLVSLVWVYLVTLTLKLIIVITLLIISGLIRIPNMTISFNLRR